jgi:hypothetical protein
MELVREAVGFFGVAGLAKSHCGFVQRARSDGRIIVEQSDAFKCFPCIIEISASRRWLGLCD